MNDLTPQKELIAQLILEAKKEQVRTPGSVEWHYREAVLYDVADSLALLESLSKMFSAIVEAK